MSTPHRRAQRNVEYARRVKAIGRLGRMIMQCLDPRHRYLFLEYERQVGVSQELERENAYQDGLQDGQAERPCCRLAMPNKMPNKTF